MSLLWDKTTLPLGSFSCHLFYRWFCVVSDTLFHSWHSLYLTLPFPNLSYLFNTLPGTGVGACAAVCGRLLALRGLFPRPPPLARAAQHRHPHHQVSNRRWKITITYRLLLSNGVKYSISSLLHMTWPTKSSSFCFFSSSRMITLTLTVVTLNLVHHSPLLAVCAVYTGAAAYMQSTYVSWRSFIHMDRCVVVYLHMLLFPFSFLAYLDGHEVNADRWWRWWQLWRGELSCEIFSWVSYSDAR